MNKEYWTEALVLAEIKKLMKQFDTETIPKHRDIGLYNIGLLRAFRKFGGTAWACEKLGVTPEKASPTDWTEELIVKEVKRCMDILDIHDRMPTHSELDSISSVTSGIRKFGGSKAIAEKVGVPWINRRYIKKEDSEPPINPSKAFEKAKEANQQGKSYADIQKEETERLSGKIDLTAYAGLKTYRERMEEKK